MMREVINSESKSEVFSYLEKFIKLFPLLLLVVYAVGYLYLKFYFSGLGIFFEYYISLSDILFFSLNRLVIFGLIYITYHLMIWLSFVIQSFNMIQKINEKAKNIKIARRAFSINKRNIYLEFRRYLIGLLIISSFFYLVFGAFSKVAGPFSIVFNIFVVSFILGGQYLIFSKNEENNRKLDVALFKIGIIVVLICVSSIFLGVFDSYMINKKSNNLNLKFQYHGKEYSTLCNDYFYVGETSQYLFLFERLTKTSNVFPKDDITNLQFFSKQNF